MTMMVLEGLKWSKVYKETNKLPVAEKDMSADEKALMKILSKIIEKDPSKFETLSKDLVGITEETTTGVLRLNHLAKEGLLPYVAVNINDSVTKAKFDNVYGCRHSVIDGIYRATDVLVSGKKVLVFGYGDVGKGCA